MAVLDVLFCVNNSVCSFFLRFGRCIIVNVLLGNQHADVKNHNAEEVKAVQEAFAKKYSTE